jgi:hypothetical protein
MRLTLGPLLLCIRQQVREISQDASLLLGVALLEFLGIETLPATPRFRVADAVKFFEQFGPARPGDLLPAAIDGARLGLPFGRQLVK